MCHPAWLVVLVTSSLISSSLGAPKHNAVEGVLRLKQNSSQEELGSGNDIHNIVKRQNFLPAELLRAYARLGDLQRVQLYLSMNISVDSQDIRNWTSLMWASRYGHAHVVTFLLEQNASVNLQNNMGDTALLWSVGGGHIDVVELLMQYGADPNIPEIMGLTPVSVAAAMGREAELRLMDKYAWIDLDHQDVNGRTPLNLASTVGQAAMVQLLGYYGNVDTVDKNAMGPVHWSVNLVDSSTLIACLNLCPDLTLVDDRNNTPLQIAKLVGNTDAVEHIEAFLAQPNVGCWLGGEEFRARDYTFFDCKQIQCMCRGFWRHSGVIDPNCVKRTVDVLTRQEVEKYEHYNGTWHSMAPPNFY